MIIEDTYWLRDGLENKPFKQTIVKSKDKVVGITNLADPKTDVEITKTLFNQYENQLVQTSSQLHRNAAATVAKTKKNKKDQALIDFQQQGSAAGLTDDQITCIYALFQSL